MNSKICFCTLICLSTSSSIADPIKVQSRNVRRLGVETSNVNGEQFCWEPDTGFRGTEVQVIENVYKVESCQEKCQALDKCMYYSHADITHLCVLYENVTSLKDSAGVVSGPKYCPQGLYTSGSTIPPSMNSQTPISSDAKFGQLVTPNELLMLINQKTNEINELHNNLVSNTDATERMPVQSEAVAAPISATLGRVATPNVFNVLISNVLGRGPFLGNIASLLTGSANLEPTTFVESAPAVLTSGIQNAETLFAAGNTFLKTVPLADLIQAGSDLFTNVNPALLKDGVQGGVAATAKNKEAATSPPTGVDAPEVTCLSEGMKCCVPRNAAPRYQTSPPKLNGVAKARCAAQYSSATDQLCVTTKYVDDECETLILETTDYHIYRNIMELPGKTMNNAICECLISKRSVEPDILSNRIATEIPAISGNGRWQYSLVAIDNQNQASERFIKTLDRFSAGADLASKVTTSYANNLNTAGLEGAVEQGQIASDVLNVLGELSKSFKSFV